MNEAGVLGRFIPDFGKRRGDDAVQHVPPLHGRRAPAARRRRAGRDRPRRGLATSIRSSTRSCPRSRTARRSMSRPSCTTSPRAGRRTIRIAGARIARRLCPRLGLTRGRDRHRRLAGRAPSADVDDGPVARHLRPQDHRDLRRRRCSRLERLKLLLILTVADIRAVGPGVWNGWKGQLLRSLFWETEVVLAGGHSSVERRASVRDRAGRAAGRAVRLGRGGRSTPMSPATIAPYWLKVDLRAQARHARFMRAVHGPRREPRRPRSRPTPSAA